LDVVGQEALLQAMLLVFDGGIGLAAEGMDDGQVLGGGGLEVFFQGFVAVWFQLLNQARLGGRRAKREGS